MKGTLWDIFSHLEHNLPSSCFFFSDSKCCFEFSPTARKQTKIPKNISTSLKTPIWNSRFDVFIVVFFSLLFLFVPHELTFPISPLSSPLSPDLAGCSEDSPDAAARGKGLHQLLVLWDQADCLRGLRLPKREAFPVPGRHRIHLPDQQQCLPLGLIHTIINKYTDNPERQTGKNRQMYTYRLPPGQQTQTLHTKTARADGNINNHRYCNNTDTLMYTLYNHKTHRLIFRLNRYVLTGQYGTFWIRAADSWSFVPIFQC